MVHRGRAAGNFKRGTKEFLLACVLVHTTQQCCAEEIRVGDLIPKIGKRIAETGSRVTPGPIKLLQNVLGCTDRHAQTARVLALLISIQKCVTHKGCAYQVGCSSRHHNFPCLPGKTISPAPVRNALRPKSTHLSDHQLATLPPPTHPTPQKS